MTIRLHYSKEDTVNMKRIIIAVAAALIAVSAGAQEQKAVNQTMEQVVDDYQIVSDEVMKP